MPEVILPGAAGRIEGRYSPGKRDNAPIALILHPHPKAGGHMNNPVAVTLHQIFQQRGFARARWSRACAVPAAVTGWRATRRTP